MVRVDYVTLSRIVGRISVPSCSEFRESNLPNATRKTGLLCDSASKVGQYRGIGTSRNWETS